MLQQLWREACKFDWKSIERREGDAFGPSTPSRIGRGTWLVSSRRCRFLANDGYYM